MSQIEFLNQAKILEREVLNLTSALKNAKDKEEFNELVSNISGRVKEFKL